MSTPVVLKIYKRDKLVSVKQFSQDQIVIGRQSDSALSLDDESISPLHAVIEKKGDVYQVSDLGSETGLFLEGAKVLESEIKSGQLINIGPFSVRFYLGVPESSEEPEFGKTHEKPRISKERLPDLSEIKSKHVAMFSPENTNPGVDLDDELTNSGVDVDDEITNSGVDLNEDVEVTNPGIEVASDVTNSGIMISESDNSNDNTVEVASSGEAAPRSTFSSVDELIDPSSRGSVVEVIIAWQERVLKTYHFMDKQKVRISNVSGTDMYVPLPGNRFKHELLEIDDLCTVKIAPSMAGELYKDGQIIPLSELPRSNKLQQSQGGSRLVLEQGEMLRLGLLSDKVSAYVRYVEDAPKAASAPFFDFTSSELVGIFMSVVVVSIMALYMLFYSPASLEDPNKLLEDSLKKAVITFKPPVKYVPPKEPEKIPEKLDKPVKKKVTEKKKKSPVKKKVAKKPVRKKVGAKSNPKKVRKAGGKNGDGTNRGGKPKAAAPSKIKTKNKAGSSRPGGSVKTGKAAANAKSKQVDVTKVGLMGAISGGGKNTALDKAYSGVGTTIGTADSKTGFQGQLGDQKGDGIGTKLQKAGSGGKGSSLVGVGGITTSGRGGGKLGYGTGGGLGGKGKANISIVDGVGDDFYSSIDQDAIRRLIRKNRNLLSGCYEIALAKNKNVRGKIVLQWDIKDKGKMINGKVKSSDVGDKSLANCIIRRLSTLKFPDPGPNEIAEVSYPFVFEAR